MWMRFSPSPLPDADDVLECPYKKTLLWTLRDRTEPLEKRGKGGRDSLGGSNSFLGREREKEREGERERYCDLLPPPLFQEASDRLWGDPKCVPNGPEMGHSLLPPFSTLQVGKRDFSSRFEEASSLLESGASLPHFGKWGYLIASPYIGRRRLRPKYVHPLNYKSGRGKGRVYSPPERQKKNEAGGEGFLRKSFAYISYLLSVLIILCREKRRKG